MQHTLSVYFWTPYKTLLLLIVLAHPARSTLLLITCYINYLLTCLLAFGSGSNSSCCCSGRRSSSIICCSQTSCLSFNCKTRYLRTCKYDFRITSPGRYRRNREWVVFLNTVYYYYYYYYYSLLLLLQTTADGVSSARGWRSAEVVEFPA